METLSDRYAIPRSTVYYWLDRLEEPPIKEAIQDDDRPRRPPALTSEERDELHDDLVQSPQTFDFEAESWPTEILQEHIEENIRWGIRRGIFGDCFTHLVN